MVSINGYPGLGPLIVSGEISGLMFFHLIRQLPAVRALRRVDETHAVMLGAGVALSGEKILPLAEADRKEAFPHG